MQAVRTVVYALPFLFLFTQVICICSHSESTFIRAAILPVEKYSGLFVCASIKLVREKVSSFESMRKRLELRIMAKKCVASVKKYSGTSI